MKSGDSLEFSASEPGDPPRRGWEATCILKAHPIRMEPLGSAQGATESEQSHPVLSAQNVLALPLLNP